MDDFAGLRVLWPEKDRNLKKYNHDIILVHGLHSGSISDWAVGDAPFWPVDLLAHDLDDTRVLSFGYHASKSNVRSDDAGGEQTIFNHGERLCSDLHDHYKLLKSASPTITFVGHGTGGIVIKSALCYSHSRQSQFGTVLQKTKHVIFLDTPHTGINPDAWRSISRGTMSENSEGQWKLWSSVLSDLRKVFSEIAPRFNITSACASLRERSRDTVVLGDTGLTYLHHEHVLHFEDVKHSTICKFSDRGVNYQRLLNRIRAGRLRFTKDTESIQKIRRWIGIGVGGQSESQSESMTWNMNDHERCLKQYHPGTCKWLFEDETFKDWAYGGGDNRILWLTAPAGTGKSVMCSIANQKLANMPASPATPYLMLTYKRLRNKCEMATLIASQLLDYTLKERGVDTEALSLLNLNVGYVDNIHRLIRLLVSQCSSVYFFLDGLDEIRLADAAFGNPAQLEDDLLVTLEFLSGLAHGESNTRVRVWCSSQTSEQTIRLMKDLKYAEVGVEKSHMHDIARDVSRYLSDLEENVLNKITDPVEKFGSTIGLQAQAGSNFRWASLMKESLAKAKTPNSITKKILQGLPTDLRELYRLWLKELKKLDDHDREEGDPPLSMDILSILAYAKRPLKMAELQEALSVAYLPPEGDGYRSLSRGDLVERELIKHRCAPLADFVPSPADPDDGYLQLSHASVYEFLHKPTATAEGSETCNASGSKSDGAVDECLIGNSCLKYLSQTRYARPLKKVSPTEFRTAGVSGSPEDIRQHHFLRYAAKYWYRHLESVDCRRCKDIERFMVSPQFITALQVQSLFVMGHFINSSDNASGPRKVIKQNIPGWFRSCDEGRPLTAQYEIFLSEWSRFLQFGVTKFMNGEIERCMWGALGSGHFLYKHGAMTEKNKSFLLDRAGNCNSNCLAPDLTFYYDAISEDGMQLSVWKMTTKRALGVLDATDTKVLLEREAWYIDGTRDPFSYGETETLFFDPTVVSWDLYDPARSRVYPLIPVDDSPARAPPIAAARHGLEVRIGSGLFTRVGGGRWISPPITKESKPMYWEDILVQNKYTVRSRRALIKSDETTPIERPRNKISRRRRNARKPKPSEQSDNIDSSDTISSSEDGGDHGSDQLISSAEEYWTHDSSYSTNTSEASEQRTDESDEKGTASDLSSKSNSVSDGVSESDADTPASLAPSEEDLSFDSNSDATSESSAPSPSHSPGHSDVEDKNAGSDADDESSLAGDDRSSSPDSSFEMEEIGWQPRINLYRPYLKCDLCQDTVCRPRRQNAEPFYQCDVCSPGTSYDICTPCIEKGEWCKSKRHELRKMVGDRSRLVTLDTISRDDARPGISISVSRGVDGDEEFLFKYTTVTSASLYSSRPVLHPVFPLLVYPLDGREFLFANVEDNTYLVHRIPFSDAEKRGATCSPVSVDMQFSRCGRFLHVVRVTARKGGGDDATAPVHLFIQSMIVQLHTRNPASGRPTTLSRYRGVSLGKWPADAIPQLPYSLTWTPSHVYVSISSEWLQVYRMPLATSDLAAMESALPGCGEGRRYDEHVQEEIETLAVKVALPRSAKTRQIRFYPPRANAACAVVVLGSTHGEMSQPPAVLYLQRATVGEWSVVKEAVFSFGAEIQPRDDPLLEFFDGDSDCDLIAPLLDFQR